MLEKNYNPDDTKSEADSVHSSPHFLASFVPPKTHVPIHRVQSGDTKCSAYHLPRSKKCKSCRPEQIYYKHDFRPVALGSHGTTPVPYEIKIH